MKNKAFSKILVFIVLIIIVSGGVFSWQYFWAPKGEVVGEEDVDKKLTREEIENTEYETCWKPEIGKFKLTDGVYSDEEKGWSIKAYRLYDMDVPSQIAFGDLNNDEKKDAAVILKSVENGVSNYELAIVLNDKGKPFYINCKKLEDVLHTNSIAIQPETVNIYMVVPDLESTLGKSRELARYKLQGGKIIDVTKAEFSDWTYRNDKYKYEIECPGPAVLVGHNEEEILLSFPDKPGLLSKSFLLIIPGDIICSKIKEKINKYPEKIEIVNGIDFLVEIYQTGGTKSFGYIKSYDTTLNEDKCLSITFNFTGSKYGQTSFYGVFDLEKDTETFNQMLSTFRFLE